jgi:hypothetical protein
MQMCLILFAFDEGAGGGRVLAVMSFLRSDAAPLYRYQGSETFESLLLVAPGFSLTKYLQAPLLQLIMLSRHAMDGSACATYVRCINALR